MLNVYFAHGVLLVSAATSFAAFDSHIAMNDRKDLESFLLCLREVVVVVVSGGLSGRAAAIVAARLEGSGPPSC